jgi:hypothetical protein
MCNSASSINRDFTGKYNVKKPVIPWIFGFACNKCKFLRLFGFTTLLGPIILIYVTFMVRIGRRSQ